MDVVYGFACFVGIVLVFMLITLKLGKSQGARSSRFSVPEEDQRLRQDDTGRDSPQESLPGVSPDPGGPYPLNASNLNPTSSAPDDTSTGKVVG